MKRTPDQDEPYLLCCTRCGSDDLRTIRYSRGADTRRVARLLRCHCGEEFEEEIAVRPRYEEVWFRLSIVWFLFLLVVFVCTALSVFTSHL